MWQLLEKAAKNASANASEYVQTVQEKAQSIVATVQDEATSLLHAIGSARTGPVDELLYEEMEDYELFQQTFVIGDQTDEIGRVLSEDEEICVLHEQMVPVEVSYEEFWSRYFFRREQASKRDESDLADEHIPMLAENGEDEDEEESSDAELLTDEKALYWHKKARATQQQLATLKALHAQELAAIKHDLDVQFQTICDSYETKMALATVQIDEARALGYDAGIRESEAIVGAIDSSSSGQDQVVARLADTEAKLRVAQEKTTQLQSVQEELEKARKDVELWRVRAIKIKKAKEALDQQVLALKTETGSAGTVDGGDVAAAHARGVREAKEEASKEHERLKKLFEEKLGACEKEAFARGVQAGRGQVQHEVAAEIATLKAELALHRIAPAGETTGTVPVVASSDAGVATTDAASAVTDGTGAAADWGEW